MSAHSLAPPSLARAQNPGLTSELVVHIDSAEEAALWAPHVASTRGGGGASFITLVASDGVGAPRGYNRAAGVARGATLVLLQQTDGEEGDAPAAAAVPAAGASCAWLSDAATLLAARPRLGAVALGRACLAPHLDAACGTAWVPDAVKYADPELGNMAYQYVATACLAPALVLRAAAYAHVGGFDEGGAPAGESGVVLDEELSLRLWAAGWHVAQARVPQTWTVVAAADGGGAAVRDALLRAKNAQLNRDALDARCAGNAARLRARRTRILTRTYARTTCSHRVARRRFTLAHRYEVFLEVQRKNARLTALPEAGGAAGVAALYATAERELYGSLAPQRHALVARLAAIADAREDAE